MISTTRRVEMVKQLRTEGYSHVVIETNGELNAEERYDRILDLVGAAAMKDSMRHLAPGGILCNTGQLGGKWYLEEFDPIVDLAEDAYLTSFYSGNVRVERLRELFAYIGHYDVPVQPARVFSLAETAEAHRWLEGQNGFGKAVVLL